MQPHSSTNVLRKMLTNQRVSVDESILYRAKHLVLKGQVVEIHPKAKIPLEEIRETNAKTHDLDVLFEDDSILVVDKPAGLLSVATDKLEQDTLHHRCVEYARLRGRMDGVLLSTVWIKPHQASWFLQRQNQLSVIYKSNLLNVRFTDTMLHS